MLPVNIPTSGTTPRAILTKSSKLILPKRTSRNLKKRFKTKAPTGTD